MDTVYIVLILAAVGLVGYMFFKSPKSGGTGKVRGVDPTRRQRK